MLHLNALAFFLHLVNARSPPKLTKMFDKAHPSEDFPFFINFNVSEFYLKVFLKCSHSEIFFFFNFHFFYEKDWKVTLKCANIA